MMVATLMHSKLVATLLNHLLHMTLLHKLVELHTDFVLVYHHEWKLSDLASVLYFQLEPRKT